MSVTGRSLDLSTKPSSWEVLETPAPFRSNTSETKSDAIHVHSESEQISSDGNIVNIGKEKESESVQETVSQLLADLSGNDDDRGNDKSKHFDNDCKETTQSATGTVEKICLHNLQESISQNIIDTDILITNRRHSHSEVPTSVEINLNTEGLEDNFEEEDHTSEEIPDNLRSHREDTSETNKTSNSVAYYVASQPQLQHEFSLVAHEFEHYARKSRTGSHCHKKERECNGVKSLHFEENPSAEPSPEIKETPPPAYEETERLDTDQRAKESIIMSDATRRFDSSNSDHDIPKNNSAQEYHSHYGQKFNVPQTSSNNKQRTKGKTVTIKPSHQPIRPTTDSKMYATSKSRQEPIYKRDVQSRPEISSLPDINTRPVPVGGDRSDLEQIRSQSGRNDSYREREIGTYSRANGHPQQSRVIENELSAANVLNLLSKELGKFTTDMAEIILGKLKAEHESLAHQVGSRVKNEAIGELTELREQIKNLIEENATLKQEVVTLKLDSIKEKEQIKRDFEKDRLKRLRDFEERNERIDILEKENASLQEQLKEKVRLTKIAGKKARLLEEKKNKAEEEHEVKIKEFQKELNRAKGELLVFRSKRRVKSSSTENERQKTRLISHHGGSAGGRPHIRTPKNIPLVEGDP